MIVERSILLTKYRLDKIPVNVDMIQLAEVVRRHPCASLFEKACLVREVLDWTSDFDHYHPRWVLDPFTLWAQMRQVAPLATTCRYGGVYCPLAVDAVRAVTLDTSSFSSRHIEIRANQALPPYFAPPITADPPDHRVARLMLAPAFTRRAIGTYEQSARDWCRRTLARLVEQGSVDAVACYARGVSAHTIGALLGLPTEDVLAFQEWDLRARRTYVLRVLAARQSDPRDGLVSRLVAGTSSADMQYEGGIGGSLFLLLIAGVDTTAAVISSALLHLASHPGDLARLREDRGAIQSATEEFLRAFAPVSSARAVVRSAQIAGVTVPTGKSVLLAYAAANRDPAYFSMPDRIDIDRPEKGHLAFGFGIHRCPGSGLARILISVALEEWVGTGRSFRVVDNEPLAWSDGSVRGLKRLPLRFC